MNLLENLEVEFQPKFEIFQLEFNNRVKEIIAEQIPIYSAKYPFVGKITIGMGTVAVDDRDGIILHDTNWEDHDKRNPTNVDYIYDQNQSERDAANNDPFIIFLVELQTNDWCTYLPSEIIF
jgi:hypothetical protein